MDFRKLLWTVMAMVAIAFASVAVAETLYRRVSFSIPASVMVKGDRVALRDIAVFSQYEPEYKPLVEAIQGLVISDAPAPKTKSVILGAQVLEALEKSTLPIKAIGYSIPKAIAVEREGRAVTKDEIISALKNAMWEEKSLDLQVRDIEWTAEQIIPVGITRVATERLGKPSGGKMPVRTEIFVDDKAAARFLITALVDDWREVPVPNRNLERGMLVTNDDVQLVRLNLLQHPADIVASLNDIIGKRTKARINAGETVRKSLLDIPPLIPKGKRVTVQYRKGSLSASMLGIALDDGFDRGEIRIKNENSKKIVVGTVLNEDTVEVSAP